VSSILVTSADSLHDPEHVSRPQNPYNLWEFVYVGEGKSGKDEYHLINTHSGTYLTAKG
jgi:hypothetical protein